MRLYKFTPSSNFAMINIGALFCFNIPGKKDKWYLLIRRDAINCYAIRWTWYRRMKWAILAFFYKKKV